MVKEAMHSNPMIQSVYGSLNSSPSHLPVNPKQKQEEDDNSKFYGIFLN